MFRWQVSSDSICSGRQRTGFRSAGGAVRRSASPSLFLRDRASIGRTLEPRLCVLLFQLSCILLFEVLDEPPSGGSRRIVGSIDRRHHMAHGQRVLETDLNERTACEVLFYRVDWHTAKSEPRA